MAITNDADTRLSELSGLCKQRYGRISDYFKKKETLDLSLAEEIRRLAGDIEEIMILRDQKEQISTICSIVIRNFRDNKDLKLTKGQETYIYDVLQPFSKYTQTNIYGRSLAITGNLPEENTIQFNQLVQAYKLLKNVNTKTNSFTREQLKKIAELAIEHKDEVVNVCANYKIAVFDSDVTHSSLWVSSSNEKYTESIETPGPEPRQNKIQDFWIWFGNQCFDIARNCHDFPPQIAEREDEIYKALMTWGEFFLPGKDMKHKRHWVDWFHIIKKWDETSINNAANKSPAFACLCAKCEEPDFLQDPTGSLGLKRNVMMRIHQLEADSDGRIRWEWQCPVCNGTEMADRTMTRERVGDMISVVIEYAIRIIENMPLVCEFMDWFNEWRLPYITAQTLNLSPKLEERC